MLKLELPKFINYYRVIPEAFFVALIVFLIGACAIYFIAKNEVSQNNCNLRKPASNSIKFLFFVIIVGVFALAMYVFYQFMLSEGLDRNEASVGLQVCLDILIALFSLICIYRYNKQGIAISAITVIVVFVLIVAFVFAGDSGLKDDNYNDYNLAMLNTYVVMLAANVMLGWVATRTTLLINNTES